MKLTGKWTCPHLEDRTSFITHRAQGECERALSSKTIKNFKMTATERGAERGVSLCVCLLCIWRLSPGRLPTPLPVADSDSVFSWSAFLFASLVFGDRLSHSKNQHSKEEAAVGLCCLENKSLYWFEGKQCEGVTSVGILPQVHPRLRQNPELPNIPLPCRPASGVQVPPGALPCPVSLARIHLSP